MIGKVFALGVAISLAAAHAEQPAFEKGDTLVFLGGTTMVKLAEHGFLETYLTEGDPEKKLRFRDLAWQGDTVYERPRQLNFPTLPEMLERTNATVALAAFGQMEALDGEERLQEFVAAYSALLAQIEPRVGRVVLLTPHPFTRVADMPHLPDLTAHNPSVAAYAKAIRKLAEERGHACLDLSGFDLGHDSRDGIHPTEKGHRRLAEAVFKALGGQPESYRPEREDLRRAIQRKNLLWRQHWRPTNWAFAHGDRSGVPSSHDHRPGQPRWFPDEIENIRPLVEAAEKEIHKRPTNVPE